MGLMGTSAIVAGSATTLVLSEPALGQLNICNKRYVALQELCADPLKNHSHGCGFFLVC